jgi:hypothetical protein
VLHRVAAWLRGLLLRALIAAPDFAATYADVANEMLRLTLEDGKPPEYTTYIRNRFAQREVVEVPATLTGPQPAGLRLAACVSDAPGAKQDRRACCGTMNLAEYYNVERILDAEAQALARWCAEHGRFGPAGEEAAGSATEAEATVASVTVGANGVTAAVATARVSTTEPAA